MKRLAALAIITVALLSSCARADITVKQGESRAENTFPENVGAFALTVNISSGTFHTDAECRHVKNTKEENKKIIYYIDINDARADGYKPCSACAPEYKNTEDNHG